MKNKFKLASLAIVFSVGYSFMNTVQAQGGTGWGEGAKLEDAQVVVEKNRVIELPRAARNFEKFRIDPPEPQERNVRYRFNDYRLSSQDINLQMKVLTIKQDELTKLYGNYLKAGIGNYGTLYLKGYFHNKRSTEGAYGAEVSHVASSRGPVDRANSGVANSSVSAHGEKYLKGFTIGGRAGYGRDQYYFYGYEPSLETVIDRDSIKQVFNRFHADAFFHNETSGSPFIYRADLKFNHLNDRYDMSETGIMGNITGSYAIDDVSGFKVAAVVGTLSHKDSANVSRSFFKLTPTYERQLGVLNVSLGARLAFTADTVNNARSTNIYPVVRLGVEPIEGKLKIYGGFQGDLDRTTLYQLTQENPFLAQNVNVADVNKTLELYGGLSANIANYVHITGRVAYQNFRNLYFYNNSRTDSTKFELVYDNGVTNVLNLYAEAVFNYSDEVRVGLKADYNSYRTETLEQPFHRPELMASVFATYNFYDKILFNSELYYIGSSFGRILRPDGTTVIRETDNIVDLNLKADYKFSSRFTAFVMANNILGQKYERFVNYQNKSVNLIGGVTYSF
ncbi:hypothetical protein FVR03_09060 [Pontibacter qinzhouensis]|uniref:TonB-dependent receptor n=1 Tax=Pontibacter qinzhouensis TaxID=2603253 RepID=A0A5C8K9U7_9BACT|nr:hypothetical protein [Pontibacter qinzhouensis]TXK47683.1 hypothetical protein FVR03_09060 [Pontibacter qinzhouensis]